MNNSLKISTTSEELIKQKKYDSIPFRIEFIKELLNGNKLDPMIKFDNYETEQMANDITCIANKKIYNFNKIITQIGGKLLYMKSGTTGHTFKGICKPNPNININYAVKIVAYPIKEKYGDLNDAKRPENAELLMIRLLSHFVIHRQTPSG